MSPLLAVLDIPRTMTIDYNNQQPRVVLGIIEILVDEPQRRPRRWAQGTTPALLGRSA